MHLLIFRAQLTNTNTLFDFQTLYGILVSQRWEQKARPRRLSVREREWGLSERRWPGELPRHMSIQEGYQVTTEVL